MSHCRTRSLLREMGPVPDSLRNPLVKLAEQVDHLLEVEDRAAQRGDDTLERRHTCCFPQAFGENLQAELKPDVVGPIARQGIRHARQIAHWPVVARRGPGDVENGFQLRR